MAETVKEEDEDDDEATAADLRLLLDDEEEGGGGLKLEKPLEAALTTAVGGERSERVGATRATGAVTAVGRR